MTRTSPFIGIVLLVSSVALAQNSSPKVLKDKEATTFNEIERGFHMDVTAGPWFVVAAPSNPGGNSPFSPGQMAQVTIGMDFGERFSLGIFVRGTANRAGSDYVGKSTGSGSGDFASLIPGLTAKISIVGLADSQGVKRTWFFVRAGGGYAFYSPKALNLGTDVMAFGGVGVEYFTRLRHFSMGLEATGNFMFTNSFFGFAVTPFVRYAF
jgi:hypothetical protein